MELENKNEIENGALNGDEKVDKAENTEERRYNPEAQKASQKLINAKTLGEQNKEKKSRDKKISKKRLEIAICCLVVIAILIPTYIFAIKPILFPEAEEEQIELIDDGNGESCEVLYMSDRIAMMETIDYYDASKIYISNEKEDWSFTLDKEASQYYITGHTGAPYSTADFATLLTEFRYGATSKRLYKECEDFATYGLDEASNPISYTMELYTGAAHTVYIGKSTPTGNGYYARYEYRSPNGTITSRKALYVVDDSMYEYTAKSMVEFLTPVLTLSLEKTSYIPEQFTIFHKNEVFVDIRSLTSEEIAASETAKVSHVYTSDGCEYDSGTEYTSMLYDVLMPGISGTRVVATGSDEHELDEEDLIKFGIIADNPEIFFHLKAAIGLDSKDEPILVEQDIIFSSKTQDDKYYAYNFTYDIVVELEASAMEFLSWDVAEFAEDGIYLMLVTNVKKISFDSTRITDAYAAMGISRVDEAFTIVSVEGTSSDGSAVQKVESVTIQSNGKKVPETIDKNNEAVTGINNFKWLYAALMAVNVQFDISDSDKAKVDLEKDADVVITVETVGGKTHTMEFYFYDTRHAYYVLDGSGRFYLIIDEIAKVLNAVSDVVNGVAVDYFAKN